MLVALPVAAQDVWPSRPLTLIVPFPAGGAPDLVARAVGERLSVSLGQPVVVTNRTGSNGLIGAEAAARSKPDGYTLLVGGDALFCIAPHIYRRLPFDPDGDFVPIAGLVENSYLLAIAPGLPAQDLQSFVDYARRAEPALSFGSSGAGSQSHLTMERFAHAAGFRMLHVPFRGNNQAILAIVSGDVSAAFVGASGVPQLRAGRLRIIASTGAARSRSFPELPTLHELYPGLEMVNWQALFAPAGTPAPVLQRLEQETRAMLASGGLARKLEGTGELQVTFIEARELMQRIRRESARYAEIVKRLDLKLD